MLSIVLFVAAAAAANQSAAPANASCDPAQNRSGALLGYAGLQKPVPSEKGSKRTASAESDPQIQVLGMTESETPVRIAGNGGNPLGYSRISMRFEPCAEAPGRVYSAESRNWVRRMFAGLKSDKALTVKVAIDPTDVARTTSLTKISRDSSKNGDVWTTDFVDGAILMPYFLVDRSTVVSLDVSFIASTDYTSSAAGRLMNVVQRAVEAINPAATLITSENKDRFNRASSFVDETINGLMHRSITEHALTVHVPTESDSDREIARVMLFAPSANRTVGKAPPAPLGIWVLDIERLSKSMLGEPNRDGKLDAAGLSAPTILSFRMAENKTLGETLASRPAVTAARDAYKAAGSDKTKTAADYCAAVAREVALMGLAPIDVGAATWAAASDLAPETTANAAMMSACRRTNNFPAGA